MSVTRSYRHGRRIFTFPIYPLERGDKGFLCSTSTAGFLSNIAAYLAIFRTQGRKGKMLLAFLLENFLLSDGGWFACIVFHRRTKRSEGKREREDHTIFEWGVGHF